MIETIVIVVLILALAGMAVRQSQFQNQQTELKIQLAKQQQTIGRLEQRDSNESAQCAAALVLANTAYDALFVVDANCNIQAINESARQTFDYDAQQRASLVELTGAPELAMMVNDALQNETDAFEEQLTIDQCNYRVQINVSRHEGQVLIGLALRDITRLVRLNRARRDMVANISHELRTPIANIRLFIDSLFHDQDKPKRKESISTLRAIARETDNLLWLVQEMSDLSMIESGQAIARLIDVNLSEIVEEAAERMIDQSQHKEISLVRHVPEKLHVLCDRDLAQRVLVNLIHNAIKWSPTGDAITINAHTDDEEVTISVLDNGPGVPPQQVDRIFERFYQVDVSRSGAEGSGLGLAICRHIVEAHGGRIWAESNTDGGGGRFMFTLLSAGERQPEHPVGLGEA